MCSSVLVRKCDIAEQDRRLQYPDHTYTFMACYGPGVTNKFKPFYLRGVGGQ